ncbi:hypothetical protein BpHYR1_035125 [Brachionus plicatilis]|uniref:Uncharacterized protein n=1 Tax=Brachionus plicatilis TaxID=10195 RepID=A0A3M7RJV2_BRAPC|nr:hypothetical protein BpHYR1_035125 [Brachionus plicatilis]
MHRALVDWNGNPQNNSLDKTPACWIKAWPLLLFDTIYSQVITIYSLEEPEGIEKHKNILNSIKLIIL